MIDCPACGNLTFQIHDDPVVGPTDQLNQVIECTRCGALWTLGFEEDDEEIHPDSSETEAGEGEGEEESELGGKGGMVRH